VPVLVEVGPVAVADCVAVGLSKVSVEKSWVAVVTKVLVLRLVVHEQVTISKYQSDEYFFWQIVVLRRQGSQTQVVVFKKKPSFGLQTGTISGFVEQAHWQVSWSNARRPTGTTSSQIWGSFAQREQVSPFQSGLVHLHSQVLISAVPYPQSAAERTQLSH